MSASFGIDHPLIAVKDINATRDHFIAMGFNMTPMGKHPWGTSTSLAMFNACLIEIVGIYDDRLLDEKPAGDFHFGRHIHHHLQQREGIALSALHSSHIEQDITHAEQSGLHLSGTLEFGRDVTLPDGTTDRTKTSLALLPNHTNPRLSFFLCQQHKPELIYVPEWLEHPNTVYGYSGITIRANHKQQNQLRKQFSTLYNQTKDINGGFSVETANGVISVQSQEAIEEQYYTLPQEVTNEEGAAIVAMAFKCKELTTLSEFLNTSNTTFTKTDNTIVLSDPKQTGNTIFSFVG